MATSPRRPEAPPPNPGLADSEGQDAYPTYRTGDVPPHLETTSRPTDTNLPFTRRTSGKPLFIGVIAFALVVLVYFLWGGFNMVRTTDDAMTPGDPASAPVAGEVSDSAASPAIDPGATDDVPAGVAGSGAADATTSPGAVTAEPGAIDVPGGAVTEPVPAAGEQ